MKQNITTVGIDLAKKFSRPHWIAW